MYGVDGVYVNVRMLMSMNKPIQYKVYRAVDVVSEASDKR